MTGKQMISISGTRIPEEIMGHEDLELLRKGRLTALEDDDVLDRELLQVWTRGRAKQAGMVRAIRKDGETGPDDLLPRMVVMLEGALQAVAAKLSDVTGDLSRLDGMVTSQDLAELDAHARGELGALVMVLLRPGSVRMSEEAMEAAFRPDKEPKILH